MITIDILVGRHYEKDKDTEKNKVCAGDRADREDVDLNPESKQKAEEDGRILLSGKDYEYMCFFGSGFKRVGKSMAHRLKGGGLDSEALMQSASSARFFTDSHLGLSGSFWMAMGFKFSESQEVLDTYANGALRNYFLPRADGTLVKDAKPGFPKEYPVLARNAAAVFGAIRDGIDYLIQVVPYGQRGLVWVDTHFPIIDAFAAVFERKIHIEEEGALATKSGKPLYSVTLKEPVRAFLSGEYLQGNIEFNFRDKPSCRGVQLKRRDGHAFSMPYDDFSQMEKDLNIAAAQGVQRLS